MEDESFGLDDIGKGIEVALSGDVIRKRHICTRASNRRRIIVLVEGDAEFEGYSIGLDSKSLQLLELPSGEVSSISLDHIVAISDGPTYDELTPQEQAVVDRRTASFRKTSQTWLVSNWPNVYDRRDDEQGYYQHRQRSNMRRPGAPTTPMKPPWVGRILGSDGGSDGHSQVRHGAGED